MAMSGVGHRRVSLPEPLDQVVDLGRVAARSTARALVSTGRPQIEQELGWPGLELVVADATDGWDHLEHHVPLVAVIGALLERPRLDL
jgi:hypothetical protein